MLAIRAVTRHLSAWQSEPKLTFFLFFSAFENRLLWLGDVVQR